MKGRKAEIAGVEAEIVQCQETHDRLTGVERRTERLCASRQAQIRSMEETLEKLKEALSRLGRILFEVETLNLLESGSDRILT